MDAEYAFVAWRSLGATLGRAAWIDEHIEDDEWERRVYLAFDQLRDRDPDAWRSIYDAIWQLARDPSVRFPNTKTWRKALESFRAILAEAGIRLYPLAE